MACVAADSQMLAGLGEGTGSFTGQSDCFVLT